MATVKTSYYARAGKLNTDGVKLVSISNSKPSAFNGQCTVMKDLSPEWCNVESFKNGEMSFDYFCQLYEDTLLTRFGSMQALRETVFDRLGVTDSDTVVFLCWEKDPNMCHRSHLVKLAFSDEYVGEL